MTERQSFASRGKHFLRWTHRLFLLTGALAVAYVGLTLLGARMYQHAANDTLDRQVQAEPQQEAGLVSAVAQKGSSRKGKAREGDVLGRIEIPRLGVRVAVLEGTTSRTLRLGAGHIVGTPLPGEQGNVGIAGHRDTWFRDLKGIRNSDEIRIQTATGLSRYGVDWVQVVEPGDTGILAPSTAATLTLVTCYPFRYIGSAPERFVVHARKLVDAAPAEAR
jgi:sortase A